MRFPLVFVCAALAACAEMALPPTYPEGAAGQPLVQEQALVGLGGGGDAAVAELILAEGGQAELRLFRFPRDGKPAQELLAAPGAVASAVAAELVREGGKPVALLLPLVAARWPEALAAAAEAELLQALPQLREPGRQRWTPGAKGVPLSLRTAEVDGPRSLALFLGERPGGIPSGDEVELLRLPLWGAAVEPEVYVAGRTAWMLAGSTGGGGRREGPLRRTVGLRRGSLARGEAELHNAHGLADYTAGDLDAARREFARAMAADPELVDSVYNAAAVAALSDRDDDAIALLHRAAELDPRRVQVLGRNDEDLKRLRRRAEVRELLGMQRASPIDEQHR